MLTISRKSERNKSYNAVVKMRQQIASFNKITQMINRNTVSKASLTLAWILFPQCPVFQVVQF